MGWRGRVHDLVCFADRVARVELGRGYGAEERYRDFRAVFVDGGATAQQGRRVLAQIFRWGGLWAPVHQPGDPYATHARAGAQELCQRILAALNEAPKATAPITEEDEDDR